MPFLPTEMTRSRPQRASHATSSISPAELANGSDQSNHVPPKCAERPTDQVGESTQSTEARTPALPRAIGRESPALIVSKLPCCSSKPKSHARENDCALTKPGTTTASDEKARPILASRR